MPIAELRPDKPKIKVIFTGFFLSRVKEGNPFAEIGASADGEMCHRPRLKVYKSGDDGNPHRLLGLPIDIDQNFQLKVENTSQENIGVFTKGNFKRAPDHDENDFRWFPNLVELFGGEFPIKEGALKPIFRINSAVFYAEEVTERPMQIKLANGSLEPFGKVAEHIAANVYFDQPESRAVLRNGTDDLLIIDQSEPTRTYIIVFACDCQQAPTVSDFPDVFKVLDVPLDKRLVVDFVGEPVPGLLLVGGQGGRVPCYLGNIS